MSVANKIFQNTLWQVIIRAINVLIGVFSLSLITRILGQTGFGFYTTIFAFVQIFMILADLGLYLTLLREISAAQSNPEENHAVNNIFTIRILSSIIVLILIPIVIQFFPYAPVVKNGVVIFMIGFLFQSMISTLTAVFSKKLAMPKVALVDFANKIVYLFILLYLFYHFSSLNYVLLGNVISQFCGFVLLLIFIKKYVRLSLAWDFAYWRQIFKSTWPLAITVVLNLLYFKADTLVLSLFHSPDIVGLYGAPYRVLEVVSTFPHMFMSLILPLFTAALIAKNISKLKDILQNSFNFFSIISILMIMITWIISRPLMVALAGEEFAASGQILNILIVATANIFFGTLFTYLIVALGAQKQMIKYFLATAVIGISGYFIFIPPFGYWGAAYMTLLVEFLIVVFAYFVARKNVDISLNYQVIIKSILAGALAWLISWPLHQDRVLLALLLSVLVYGLVLYFSKAVDRQSLKKILFKNQ